MNAGKGEVRVALIVLIFSTLAACAGKPVFNRPGVEQQKPTLGVRLRVIPANTLPVNLNSSQSHVLKVVAVKPRQPAAAAGIQVGDIFLRLNNSAVTGMADSVAVMQSLRWGDTLSVHLLRGVQVMQMAVRLQREQNAVAEPALTSSVVEIPKKSELIRSPGEIVLQDENSESKTPDSASGMASVVVSRAVVRSAPSTSGDIVTTLSRGANVNIMALEGDWFSVVTEDAHDKAGYMHKSLLQQSGSSNEQPD